MRPSSREKIHVCTQCGHLASDHLLTAGTAAAVPAVPFSCRHCPCRIGADAPMGIITGFQWAQRFYPDGRLKGTQRVRGSS